MTMPIDTERKLIAILAADVEGYSRLMGADEVGTLRDLTERRRILDGLIASHRGRIANTAGDSVLAEFGSAVDAVQCAVAAQIASAEANGQTPSDRHINFRIGVHVGDVMVKAGDLFGDGVNIAARLQTIASPGGVCISGVAHDQVKKILPLVFSYLGAKTLKNIEEPVRAFTVSATVNTSKPAHYSDQGTPLALPDKPSIAVLPFANMSGDPEQDYFADGVTEDIVSALSRARWLFVIARNSSFVFRGAGKDVKRVGRELGVRYVLDGSVRKSASRLRIACQLLDAQTERQVWAENFDGSLEDIFGLQDRVAESVARAIEPNVRRAEILRARAKPTSDLGAYDLYLRAISELDEYSGAAFTHAETLLRAAIDRDPDYADALATLGWCIGSSALNGSRPQEKIVEALNLVRRATRLDHENPEVLAFAAQAEATFGGSYERSDELANIALQLNPNSTPVRYRCGVAFAYGARSLEAIEHLDVARRSSPVDPLRFLVMNGLAAAHFFAKDFEKAINFGRLTVAQHPDHNIAKRYLAASLAHLDRLDEAREVIRDLLISQPNSCLTRSRGSTFRHKWQMDLYIDGIRKAGLPE